MIKKYLHYAVAAAFAAASGASSLALAVEETANDSFEQPQRLDIVDGQVTVTGAIGVAETSTAVVPDIDYYSFQGYAGNKVTIDVDFGFKGAAFSETNPEGERNVDTIIGIWGPPPTIPENPRFFLPSDDTETGDADSIPVPNRTPPIYRDARLDAVVLPATGQYTVGVTSGGSVGGVPRMFLDDGSATDFISGSLSNGRYTLIISGISAPVVAQRRRQWCSRQRRRQCCRSGSTSGRELTVLRASIRNPGASFRSPCSRQRASMHAKSIPVRSIRPDG